MPKPGINSRLKQILGNTTVLEATLAGGVLELRLEGMQKLLVRADGDESAHLNFTLQSYAEEDL